MAVFYDLFVLLDPEAPEDRRTSMIEQVRSQIGSGGSLRGDADWGMRRLSYEIDHRREAQYHLFQFEGTPDVLRQLDRMLSIEDSVLRHRIIRLPGEPPETTPRPAEEPRRTAEDRPPREGARDQRDESEPAAEGAEAQAPPPAEQQPAAVEEAATGAEGGPGERA